MIDKKFTPEFMIQARATESPEALADLLAKQGMPLTAEEARAHFELFHQTGELSDEELDNVAGGACYSRGKMVVTAPASCVKQNGGHQSDLSIGHWNCKVCGGPAHMFFDMDPSSYGYGEWDVNHICGAKDKYVMNCGNCKHATYERGLLLCNNPLAYC